MADTPNYSFYAKPRFSANHIAEYLCTEHPRQRTDIIRDAKFPRKPAVIPYSQVKPGFTKFLAGNTHDHTHFDVVTERLEAKARQDDPYAKAEARRCLAAIEAFKATFSAARCKRYNFTQGPVDVAMRLEGVSLNIRMDVGLMEKDGNTAFGGGCVLFMAGAAASRKNIERRRKYVAAVVHWSLEGGQLEPLPRLCMSFDVFGQKVEKAPTSFDRLRENMRHSCREVAARWDEVEPPTAYDGPDWRS